MWSRWRITRDSHLETLGTVLGVERAVSRHVVVVIVHGDFSLFCCVLLGPFQSLIPSTSHPPPPPAFLYESRWAIWVTLALRSHF